MLWLQQHSWAAVWSCNISPQAKGPSSCTTLGRSTSKYLCYPSWTWSPRTVLPIPTRMPIQWLFHWWSTSEWATVSSLTNIYFRIYSPGLKWLESSRASYAVFLSPYINGKHSKKHLHLQQMMNSPNNWFESRFETDTEISHNIWNSYTLNTLK